jgi:hypothetical protein
MPSPDDKIKERAFLLLWMLIKEGGVEGGVESVGSTCLGWEGGYAF